MNIYSLKKGIKTALPMILICLLIILRFYNLVGFNIVRGSSMEPNLQDGNILFGSSLPVLLDKLDYGDIVVANANSDGQHKLIIKRIIGMPGDTIEIKNSDVYLNGEKINEKYIQHTGYDQFSNIDKILLPEDEYWLMGDNRDNSSDSRLHGPFRKAQITQKIFTSK